ncbi:MAG: hypothetical protein R2747_10980 [Pyrinomonadaceae bacterium]
MVNEESVTITETAPDGTETTIEITTSKSDDSGSNQNEESLVEEVVEALLDVEIDDDDVEEFSEGEVYEPAAETEFENSEVEPGETTFHRGDYTDIGTGSDGETTYVIGEDFSYID